MSAMANEDVARPVALVTGGSRGIGRAIATTLGREGGFGVAVNFVRNQAAAQEVVREINAAGGKAIAVRGDVASADDRRAIVEQTVMALGPIDLLVNNAGVAPDVRADILDASEQSFDRLISTNLKGPYFLTQLVARRMIDQQTRGKIVNITSVSAYAASVNRGDYCLSKAALSMMTKLFAARLAEHGINVYEIRPGVIETDMTGPVKQKYDELIFRGGLTPIARWGTPDDVARAVLAIATGLLPFSTGDVINVDGGFHLRRL
jgi:NAD(P)-dependent dehydrogenase (short-subunit alcohol dehydrogenase family)